jgi:membrane protein implicated in regulation of membrane protease activity
LLAVELATGTFYLMLLALATVAGALAAHAGLSLPLQWAAAALLGAGSTAVWHFKRARAPRSAVASANRDVNIDIGETVQVLAWNEDGSARVNYRGASWAVRFAGGAGTTVPMPGAHTIVSVQSAWLGVAPASPATKSISQVHLSER